MYECTMIFLYLRSCHITHTVRIFILCVHGNRDGQREESGGVAAAAAALESPNDDDTSPKPPHGDEDDDSCGDADTIAKQGSESLAAERSRSRADLESLFSRLYPPELAEEDGMKTSRNERLSKGYTSVTLTYGEVAATGVSCFFFQDP